MTHIDSCDLAPYACTGDDAHRRAHDEQLDVLRSPFALDRHRIIECTAFRRLEGKTQVFAPSHHDHFRTRLTHTLEASHIARTLASGLGANEDLAEAITLAHDLGHPPFGHAGEKALTKAMVNAGGFNHSLHALRVVEYLEHPFPAFRGLNLTVATRAGLSAHATVYDVPEKVGANRAPSVEAQVSSLADRIAYNCHDLEDAIGAEFAGADELGELGLWRKACARVKTDCKIEQIHAIRRPVLDAMLNAILCDAIETSMPRLTRIDSFQDVTRATVPLVVLSTEMDKSLGEVEKFLVDRVYRHPNVATYDSQGQEKILALFATFQHDPSKLPQRFAARIEEQSVDRVVCDYVAGMTDRFCEAAFAEIVHK